MSTFPGLLQEFENVSIDRFDGGNLSSTVYFLSHCHSDHMHGLREYAFRRRLRAYPDIYLYCSSVSKLWLSTYLPGLECKIKTLPMNSNISIDVPSLAPGKVQSISVTALPAGHCPGSVMFLLSSDVTNVLYTGDIRLKAKDVKKMKALKGLVLDKMYLDTTFYAAKYGYFPSRDDSMEKLVEFCKGWLDQHEENVIDIRRSAGIGIEYAYMTLHEQLGISVHVSEQEWKQYASIEELAPAVTRDESKTRIHACVEILNYHDKNDIFKLVYSSHCSHDELREIITELSPRKVVPCVVPRDHTEEQILECLLPDLPATPVTSSFESTIDLSPMRKPTGDDQPIKSCSQSSTNSFSSNDETSTKPKASFSSRRYAVRDSSDDELSLSPPKLNKSNGLSTLSDVGDEPPWGQCMQAAKKFRKE